MRRIGPVLLIVTAVWVAMPAGFGAPRPARTDNLYDEMELFTEAISIVQNEYVDETQAKDLIYGSLKGLLGHLDPNSSFLTPDEHNEMKVDTEGEFGGLGIEIAIKDELLTVIAPIDDTPADRAGIKSGDRIVKIDNELTRDVTLVEAVKKLRGKPKTDVHLVVLREGEEKLLEFTVTRDIIKIQSVKDVKLLDDHIGYIRLASFQEHTPDDLEQALQRLSTEGFQALIVDVRDNPGGLLDVAVGVSEKFLEPRQLVVSTKGRRANQTVEYHARGASTYLNFPMVVLANQGSASASEIFAGAMQDYKRAVVMGTKTFGKGSVQTVIPLRDGSALRLTTSKYFTPSGRSIHGKGIQPDVVVEPLELVAKPKKASLDEVFERVEHPEAAKPKSPDAQPAETETAKAEAPDYQLMRAVDLLKGLLVYQHATGAPVMHAVKQD